jgi:hypothetical protein
MLHKAMYVCVYAKRRIYSKPVGYISTIGHECTKQQNETDNERMGELRALLFSSIRLFQRLG